ncbi:MAG TPA: ATP-binding cassette domain-containing protein, partial [Burkholderiales bacterium]|nr:ATP-binding cassette domain-containing protein [Burkholderiales bacterium]
MSEIALENVFKRYGAVRAVDRASFRAEAGKFLVLLGPSGCGKSTVLRLIAGLEEVTEGRILIG